jgi:nucleoside-diphosphate-sugar epimerase
MQTILGANGVIGREVSRHLPQYSSRIRQVSRSPKPVNATDELFSADLLDAKAAADAVAGSAVAYLVAGLKYDHKVWEEQWPKVMRNAIDACKRHGSALVFFDRAREVTYECRGEPGADEKRSTMRGTLRTGRCFASGTRRTPTCIGPVGPIRPDPRPRRAPVRVRSLSQVHRELPR